MLRVVRVPAVIMALCLVVMAAMRTQAVAPGNEYFQRTWARTD